MLKRIIAVFMIFIIVSIAWIYLGVGTENRTVAEDRSLRERVAGLWGGPQIQSAPVVTRRVITFVTPEEVDGIAKALREIAKKKTKDSPVSDEEQQLLRRKSEITYITVEGATYRCTQGEEDILSLEAGKVEVDLGYRPRQKGLFWYPTYEAKFRAEYRFVNDNPKHALALFKFPFSSSSNIDIVSFEIDGVKVKDFGVVTQGGAAPEHPMLLKPGEARTIGLQYASKGMETWTYVSHPSDLAARNLRLTMRTDFDEIDFPAGSRSPDIKEKKDAGWTLTWEYNRTVSGVNIGMSFPEKIHPDYWVSRIIYYAPVAMFLYFFLLFLFTTVKRLSFHPVNYFFIACAFFAYHLLLVYLVDWITLHVAFWIASAVSLFLVTTYMHLVVGLRYAFVEALISQFVCLVLFSYSFFFDGMSGLTITIISIIMLFIAMQTTGRINWEERFREEKTARGPAFAHAAPGWPA